VIRRRGKTTDGALRPALNRLYDAIGSLCDPGQHIIEGRRIFTDSWYRQLCDSLPGNKGSGGRGNDSLPGCWLDALILIGKIDVGVAEWNALPGTTPERLREFYARPWRPQDCEQLSSAADRIEGWVVEIQALLNPEPHWTLPAPCPECGASVSYRKDSAGEVVRQAALHLGPDRCECRRCHTVWEPPQFPLLASVLNYDRPPGVLSELDLAGEQS